jgi:putative spermidine/putrescine transport system substrate-binding protein
MAAAWNGRLFAARRDGTELGWSWTGALHDKDYWIIPRHARHPESAARFIWFASQPDSMAQQVELVGYGPANLKALQNIPVNIREQLPTDSANFDRGVVVDSGWWSTNESEVMKKWLSWKNK